MTVQHGTVRCYRTGCRCDLCKAAKKRDAKAYSDRKKVGFPVGSPGRPAIPMAERAHGDYVTYCKGCRCQPCTNAYAQYGRDRRAIGRAEVEPPEVTQLRQWAYRLGYDVHKKRGSGLL